MMNIKLQQLLPAELPDEAAFHLVKFVNDLALALESIYFKQMLHHTSKCEYNPFPVDEESNNDPF